MVETKNVKDLGYEQIEAELKEIRDRLEKRQYTLTEEEAAFLRAGELAKEGESRLRRHSELISEPLIGGAVAAGGSGSQGG